jgi:cyclophilin family peptidyl-prolyl cis-trans isomerase
MRKIILSLLASLISMTAISQKKPKVSKDDFVVTVATEYGNMVLLLYDETPKHKENFLKLAKEGFYNDLLFHRVIKDFMIQGGDPKSKGATTDQMLGEGDVGYMVDAEFNPKLYHKKGVIAAARDGNPKKSSSGCQFYIAQGKKYTQEELEKFAKAKNITFLPEQLEAYKTIGGIPHLDQNYTVYGEVVAGLDVIDKIAAVETNTSDRPKKDVKMTVTVQKMKKSKITKLYGYQY